jgi:hypothetical protein
MPTTAELAAQVAALSERVDVLEGEPPEDAIICPECGRDITSLDVKAHQRIHYGDTAPDPRHYKQAAARWDELEAHV